MNKFKVGDRVKVISDSCWHGEDISELGYKGQIGTVTKIDGDGDVRLMEGATFKPYQLELVSDIPKRYDMDKWLEDNDALFVGTLGYMRQIEPDFDSNQKLIKEKYSITYRIKDIKLEMGAYEEGEFNKSIIDFVEACNKLGANLSYPEEIQEPKFKIAKELKKNGFTKSYNSIYVHQESDYMVNLDKIEHTEENLKQILIAAEASAKIVKKAL